MDWFRLSSLHRDGNSGCMWTYRHDWFSSVHNQKMVKTNILFSLTFLLRKEKVIKAATPALLVVILVGIAISFISSPFWSFYFSSFFYFIHSFL